MPDKEVKAGCPDCLGPGYEGEGLCSHHELLNSTTYDVKEREKWVEEAVVFHEFAVAACELLRKDNIFPKRMSKLLSDDLSIYPKDREEARQIRHALRTLVDDTQWKRKLDILNKDKMQYWADATWTDGEKQYKFEIYLRSVMPPESCKIVYDEVEVPATVRRDARLVCGPEED